MNLHAQTSCMLQLKFVLHLAKFMQKVWVVLPLTQVGCKKSNTSFWNKVGFFCSDWRVRSHRVPLHLDQWTWLNTLPFKQKEPVK